MKLQVIPRVSQLSPAAFREQHLKPGIPVIIEDLAKDWVAYQKWNWELFRSLVGDVEVEVYNNIRAGARVLVNGGDGRMPFREYVDVIRKGPSDLRLFLFNIFKHAPDLKKDFVWPDRYMGGFIKAFPVLFVGGAGSIAHMHYDLDLGHIFHTQFIGKKRVLLFPHSESRNLYQMPLTVESAAGFVNWDANGVDYAKWPALRDARGYEGTLGHGDTLFMPTKTWHHMEYLESGFAMSLRALPHTLGGKLNSVYHLLAMRGLNNLLISARPEWWYHKKREIAYGRVGQQYVPAP